MCERNSTAFVDCRFKFSLTSLNPSNFFYFYTLLEGIEIFLFFSKRFSITEKLPETDLARLKSHVKLKRCFSFHDRNAVEKSFWESRVCFMFRVVSAREKRWSLLARIGEEKQPLDDYINRIRLQRHNIVISIKKVGFAQRFLGDRKSLYQMRTSENDSGFPTRFVRGENVNHFPQILIAAKRRS